MAQQTPVGSGEIALNKSSAEKRGDMFTLTGVVGLLSLAAFQNCSSPPPPSSADAVSVEAKKLDFSYEAGIDQISYMSCPAFSEQFDASADFSFRAGAYSSTGIRLTPAFRDVMAKKTPDKQAAILMESPQNSGMQPQLALRYRQGLQSILTAKADPQPNGDFVTMFEPLGTPDLAVTMIALAKTEFLRYLRSGTPQGSRMEGSLAMAPNAATVESIRSHLKNDALLALTYTDGGSSSQDASYGALSPSHFFENTNVNPDRAVYGRGYTVTFAQPSGGVGNSVYPSNVVRTVNEVNLLAVADQTGLKSWTCPESRRFRIVRPEDIAANVANVNCAIAPDPDPMSSELQILRRQLRVEDWFIDTDHGCIIPKHAGNSCYGTQNSKLTIEYDLSKSCEIEGASPLCVAFVSVCTRTE